ncbi:MAG: hypothetical protein SCK29_00620 [Bacillota bacterium]|nr:hypothetical protein [Bacillota bacterium]MDW7682605.1 hypothetical protein [Bacillota bacterium]
MAVTFRNHKIQAELLDPRQDFRPVRHDMEFRYDPLTGRSTRLAHFGAIRPQPVYFENYDGANKGFCPFCPPNMDRVTSLFPKDLIPEGRLKNGEATLIANIAPYDAYSGLVVLSDKHILPMEELTAARLHDSLSLGVEFLQRVAHFDPDIPYFFIGWNYMPPSGGGLIHAHMQVFGSTDPGNIFWDALCGLKRYREENKRPFWPDLLAEEEQRNERYLGRIGDIHWLVPYAPLGVLGDVIAVLPRPCSPAGLAGDTLENLVAGLVRLFAYYKEKKIFSFNASVHFTPECNQDFPLMIRFSPRTFLNASCSTPDTNFFHVSLQQPICVVRPEELATEVKPFFFP